MAGAGYVTSAPPLWALWIPTALVATSASMTATSIPVLAASLVLGWTLVALASIDIGAYRLPDVLTLPLLAAGLAVTAALAPDRLGDHLIGAAAGYGALAGLAWLYRRIRGRDGLGLGDAKLLAAAGAWLGWRQLPLVLLMAALTGLALATVMAWKSRHLSPSHRLPFGAPLALAIWVGWLGQID